jgi:hypothetical protein
VLLEQLSQLSRASTAPSVAANGPVRSLVAAITVAVVGGFAWLTGTLPGVASPFDHDPAPRQAPSEPAQTGGPSDESGLPGVPPGQTQPRQDNGNHYGQTKPHDNNGNHYGQTKPHQNNGNHYGQTKPHQNNGNHNGQTKPDKPDKPDNANSGSNNGQTQPEHSNASSGHGNGNVK